MNQGKNKVIQLNLDIERYRKLARQMLEQDKLYQALGFLFSALKIGETEELFADIANVYSEMGLLELSNKYWFYYLDRCPKEKASIAYEEIAINYFYMDNLLASGYYFHKKVSTDGFISKENLDQEIIDFYSEVANPRNSYYVAYPFNRADFSKKIKEAKRNMALTDFRSAEKIFSAIPSQCLNEDACGDYALSLFLQKKDDKAIAVCKDSLEKHGKNLTAFCSLSTIYKAQGDSDKAEYYYKEALNCRTGDRLEDYKLAPVALENGDTKVACECLKTVIEDRPYDVDMKFFYALAQMNSGNYQQALKIFSEAYRTNPEDLVVKYFLEQAKALSQGDTSFEKYLPLKYHKELPKHTNAYYKRRIRDLTEGVENGRKKFNTEEYLNLIKWGLEQDDLTLAQKCIYLAVNFGVLGKEVLLKQLLSYLASERVKRAIVFWLIAIGHKQKFSIVANTIFVSVKPAKLVFEKDQENASLLISAYALAVSKLVFMGYQETHKIAFAANRIYGKVKRHINDIAPTVEVASALIVYLLNRPEFSDVKNLCAMFGISQEDFQNTLYLYENFKGEKND